jgi:hypothetical protein
LVPWLGLPTRKSLETCKASRESEIEPNVWPDGRKAARIHRPIDHNFVDPIGSLRQKHSKREADVVIVI